MTERFLPLLGSLALVGSSAGVHGCNPAGTAPGASCCSDPKKLGENLRDGLALALFARLVGQAIVWARSLQTLRPWGAEHSARVIWQASGAGLLLVGLAPLVTAQLQLGASWRIGLDESAGPGL